MAKGINIPKSLRRDIDALKDETVNKIFERSHEVSKSLAKFREEAFSDIDAYLEILGEQYNIKYEGKGNISLTNYEETRKIERSVQDRLVFDEKLQIAKALIDKCIKKWSNGTNDNIVALVELAFKVDKQGKIRIDSVLNLRSLKIEDEDWRMAMQAISDSISITGSRSYVRLYERADEYSKWEQVSLNLASIKGA